MEEGHDEKIAIFWANLRPFKSIFNHFTKITASCPNFEIFRKFSSGLFLHPEFVKVDHKNDAHWRK
jgi:hypothetical protein